MTIDSAMDAPEEYTSPNARSPCVAEETMVGKSPSGRSETKGAMNASAILSWVDEVLETVRQEAGMTSVAFLL